MIGSFVKCFQWFWIEFVSSHNFRILVCNILLGSIQSSYCKYEYDEVTINQLPGVNSLKKHFLFLTSPQNLPNRCFDDNWLAASAMKCLISSSSLILAIDTLDDSHRLYPRNTKRKSWLNGTFNTTGMRNMRSRILDYLWGPIYKSIYRPHGSKAHPITVTGTMHSRLMAPTTGCTL